MVVDVAAILEVLVPPVLLATLAVVAFGAFWEVEAFLEAVAGLVVEASEVAEASEAAGAFPVMAHHHGTEWHPQNTPRLV